MKGYSVQNNKILKCILDSTHGGLIFFSKTQLYLALFKYGRKEKKKNLVVISLTLLMALELLANQRGSRFSS